MEKRCPQLDVLPRFAYSKLTRLREIRTLLVLPVQESDQLECLVQKTQLRDKWYWKIPEYLALSYTWGDPTTLS
jgi:hypothetical protein